MVICLQELSQAFQRMVEMQTNFFIKLDEGGGGNRGGEGGSGGGGNDTKREVLSGKGFEMMDKFSGGESKWNKLERRL